MSKIIDILFGKRFSPEEVISKWKCEIKSQILLMDQDIRRTERSEKMNIDFGLPVVSLSN